jgi:autoinducer 2-degrading protein
MIQRIVKMTFAPGKEKDFLEVFKKVSPLIRSFEGCTHLELLREKKDGTIFFTLSTWETEEDLNKYRSSELFAKTWEDVKKLFSEKAEAWTTTLS